MNLAFYYLQKIPFASKKPYKIFLSFMSIANFLTILRKIHLNDRSEIDLLVYHIKPLLEEKAKSVKDLLLIKEFLEYVYSSV